MLIPIIRGQTLQSVCKTKNIDYDFWFSEFKNINEEKQTIIVFVIDWENNPVYSIQSIEEKVEILAEYFKFDKKVVEKTIENIYINGSLENKAARQYLKYKPSPLLTAYYTFSEKLTELNNAWKTIKIDKEFLLKDDKGAERFMAYAKQNVDAMEDLSRAMNLIKTMEEQRLFEQMIIQEKSLISNKTIK